MKVLHIYLFTETKQFSFSLFFLPFLSLSLSPYFHSKYYHLHHPRNRQKYLAVLKENRNEVIMGLFLPQVNARINANVKDL